jgi:hypothetical protein
MRDRNFRLFSLIFVLLLQLQLAACGGGTDNTASPQVVEWPIAKEVSTTAQQQTLPIGLSSTDTPVINPADVSLYELYGYSGWRVGVGTPYVKRTELAPSYNGAPNAARLLSFFSMSDIHITDKESPAQPINPGWSALFGPTSAGLFVSSYSPIILSTTSITN